jgi:hypothetical protein
MTKIRMMTRRSEQLSITGLLIAIACLAPLVIAASGPTASAENPQDILIVVNNSSKISQLSVAELRDYFLKTRKTWPDGSKVVPINAKEVALRDAFRVRVLSMSAAEEQRYWQNQAIRTGEQTPPEFDNTLKATYRLPGAVSYVFRKNLVQKVVKVVSVVPVK